MEYGEVKTVRGKFFLIMARLQLNKSLFLQWSGFVRPLAFLFCVLLQVLLYKLINYKTKT